jgi:hypothetical protein
MKIRKLQILPPFAIGRFGSASEPMDNFTLEFDPAHPLGFRDIRPRETFHVNEHTGEIERAFLPTEIVFTQDDCIRPVAPFLEVFALDESNTLVPLDGELLKQLKAEKLEWRVSVANRKVCRRTGDDHDIVHAELDWFSDHTVKVLEGHCHNFRSKNDYISFGHVQFIAPREPYTQVRLRFTPAKGRIYGTKQDTVIPEERALYDEKKGKWFHFAEKDDDVKNETLPPSLYAIEPPAPSWLNDNIAISRGYLDDACDGIVEFRLTVPGHEPYTAMARICSAPPAVVPDSLFVRSLADDFEQLIHGPEVSRDEQYEVTRDRALDIVRRAFETVRCMNVTVMNGNDFMGRSSLSLDSMPEEEAADTERAIRPVMSPATVDTFTILALHQHVYTALAGGAAPWFVELLRKPDEVADYTDHGRRKMPALMCGADNNYLALTYRQIDTIRKATQEALFQKKSRESAPKQVFIEPLNRTAQQTIDVHNLSAQFLYEAAGNPISSSPLTSVANCCPGLEVDFRAVWRRVFKGIVLREYDNLVMGVDAGVRDPKIKSLVGRRLLRVRSVDGAKPELTRLMMTPIKGPAPSDPNGEIRLTTQFNPDGVAAVEWSNALAHILHAFQGKSVRCDFTKNESEYPAEIRENPANYETVKFEVRNFFEAETAVISTQLAVPGELTQGLCSPWQNDYRECSCYYWASARPDYVNVEPAGNGLSKGDNWFQKERTGAYVPDDYQDRRLVLYDELFHDWEHWLRFLVKGQDCKRTTTPLKARGHEAGA